MIILVDKREQAPYDFKRYPDVEVVSATLNTGDYSLEGMSNQVAVERKSLDDLIGCLMGENRDRFERELIRAIEFKVFAVVVEAHFTDLTAGRYRSMMKPHAAAQSITAFYVRYGIPFLFAGHRPGGEYLTKSILQKALTLEIKRNTFEESAEILGTKYPRLVEK